MIEHANAPNLRELNGAGLGVALQAPSEHSEQACARQK